MLNKDDRYLSIDLMRGLAVSLMILAHTQLVLGWAESYSVMLASPFFLITSGISYEIFFVGHNNSNRKFKTFESIFRALNLYFFTIIGLFIGSYFWPTRFQFGLLQWSVFQVIVVGYLLGPFFPSGLLKESFIILLVFMISYLINQSFGIHLSFLTTGITPIIPWIAYFLIGRLLYRILISKNSLFPFRYHVSIFSILVYVGIIFLTLINYYFLDIDRQNAIMFILISAIYFSIFCLLRYLVDYLSIKLVVLNPIERVGRIAFSSYYIHFFIIFIIHLLKEFFHLSLNPSVVNNVILAILIIVCLSLLECTWRKYNYALGMEWLLRKATKGLLSFL